MPYNVSTLQYMPIYRPESYKKLHRKNQRSLKIKFIKYLKYLINIIIITTTTNKWGHISKRKLKRKFKRKYK